MINPRRDARFWLHRKHLDEVVDVSAAKGLEIGAFDLPSVTAFEGDCTFADFRTTDELIALAAVSPGHSPNFVQPVAFDLRHGYDALPTSFDYVVASHVVEHVPDLAGWFTTLGTLLLPGGAVFLVIPDKRFTFDVHRRLTDFTDIADCHRQKLTQPTARQVFDYHYSLTHVNNVASIWNGTATPPPPSRDYLQALMFAERAEAGYEDAHCSVFTPDSFVDLANQMRDAGLLQLRLEDVRPTQYNQLDFTVVLRKP